MTTLKAQTLRPGLLVSLKTSVSGNVQYNRVDLEPEYLADDGTTKARWETLRTVSDAKEHERAIKVRSKAGNLIRAVCAKSAFGLLCPEADAPKLDEAVAKARELIDDFNASASLTRVAVYVIAGHVASDDAEAAKAIASEVKDLMDAMSKGIENADVKTIREAAVKAKSVGQMLTPDMQARVQIAVDVARQAAKNIVKAGEQAAQEIDLVTMRKIAEQRTAFLDLDGGTEVAAPTEKGRTLDLAPVTVEAPKAKVAAFDLD